eukprot:Skav201094  [mRNA]  locus=scaffold2562:165817:169473:+ [translate_table: standard]
MAQPPIEVLCKECFTREDPGGTGRLDRSRFQSALGRVFASLQPLVPQPDATWFDRVYESYSAKCGGNGVSVRAMEDAAKQFVTYHQKKRAESAKQTEAPAVRDLPAALPAKQPVAGSRKKQIIEDGPRQFCVTVRVGVEWIVVGETSPQGCTLPQQVPFSPPRDLAAAVPSRPGYGKAVELASAVMCPMKQGSSVREAMGIHGGWGQQLGGSQVMGVLPNHQVLGMKCPVGNEIINFVDLLGMQYAMSSSRGVHVFTCVSGWRDVMVAAMFRQDYYIMDDSQKLGEGSFGQVCVVTHKVTGQKRACKRVAVQTEMEPGQQRW